MNSYRVWFDQINAQMIEVRAHDEDEAKIKAARIARPCLEDMVPVDVVKMAGAKKRAGIE
jgi:hypothetical protein